MSIHKGANMTKSKSDRDKQEVQLAEVWPERSIETEGAVGPTIGAKAYRKELAELQIELVKLQGGSRRRG
jgi:polyphosphate kinase 2 (PPK2 family)